MKREIKQWFSLDITYITITNNYKVTVKHKDRTRERSLALTLVSFSVVNVTKSFIEFIYKSESTIHQYP